MTIWRYPFFANSLLVFLIFNFIIYYLKKVKRVTLVYLCWTKPKTSKHELTTTMQHKT